MVSPFKAHHPRVITRPNGDSEDTKMANSGGSLQTIDLEFETLREFREIMAPRFNYDGFFVEKADPLPRGTRAQFRFVLPDGYVLAEGTGVVAWSRFEDEGSEKPPGMALLFDALDQQNREVVDELVEFHRSTGGEPFDLGPRASEAGDIGTDALSGDVFDVPPPPESAVPGPSESGVESTTASTGEPENHLPEWLSEVAQNHDKEILEEHTGPDDDALEADEAKEGTSWEDTPNRAQELEPPGMDELERSDEPGLGTRPAMPELDTDVFRDEETGAKKLEDEASDVVTLEKELPDVGVFEEDGDGTPFREDAEPSPEITLPQRDEVETPRGLRVRYILPVVAVLIAASAIVFWLVNRTIPLDAPPTEPVDTARAAEDPGEVEEDAAAEQVADPSEQAAGKPAAIAETPFDEPAAAESVTEEVAQPAARTPATRLLLVTATRAGGETVVTVRGNGEMNEATVRVVPLKDPARVWIRVTGIETFYRPNEIEVGTPEVERLRVGHHPEETPQSIYVVADLASPAATIRDHTIEGDTLRVVIAR
jgi:hypothetical protein